MVVKVGSFSIDKNTKICGKIIESRFCIVILDDTIIQDANIPNPNVYYEYGLMTSLRKHIIPLQQIDLELAFNIQSYDTIKYSQRNIGAELDRAIRDAIRITEEKEPEVDKPVISDKSILRKLELAGLEVQDESEWFLSSIISDTQFKGFEHHDENHCTFIGKIDSESEFVDYLEDLNVVIYRTNNKATEIEKEIKEYHERYNAAKGSGDARDRNLVIRRMQIDLERNKSYLANLEKVQIIFIIDPELDSKNFIKNVQDMTEDVERYKITFSNNHVIIFNGTTIDLTPQFM